MFSSKARPRCFTARGAIAAGLLIAIATVQHAAADGCEVWLAPFASGGQVGMNSPVRALTTYEGDLIAAGDFITAGGQTVNRIARWDGSAWHPLSSGGQIGVNAVVYTLFVHNGDLIAGGQFTTAGGQTVNHIARWDGSAWHPFLTGGEVGLNDAVWALTEYDGELIAGGGFTHVGAEPLWALNRIGRWDGSAWHPLTSGGQIGVSNNHVFALTVHDGNLIAGGTFDIAGGQTANAIASWDGSAWQPFTSGGQTGVDGQVYALSVHAGNLICGGSFVAAGGQTVHSIASWDGSAWHPLTSADQVGLSGQIFTLTVYNGGLIAAGEFGHAGGQTVNFIARWDGSAWNLLTSGGQIGVSGPVRDLTVYDGDLIVGGFFTTAGGQTVNRIARWGSVSVTGACCINGTAIQTTAADCATVGGAFNGEGVPSGDVVCDPHCPADLTGNGSVGVNDLLQLLNAWGACP